MSVTWDEYIQVPDARRQFNQCRRVCREAFARQRTNIERVFDHTRAKTVACLGAGILNDIPYARMIKAGAEIHLVDWVPGTLQAGIEMSIVQKESGAQPSCIYCESGVSCPQEYCRRYRQAASSDATVCDRYDPIAGSPPRCGAFEPGSRPSIHCADVTGGYASTFGRQILNRLRGARSWKQAFERAADLAGSIKRHPSELTIPAGGIELVTSSMVVSQFDHEPYEYFSRRAADLLGPPSARDEKRLRPVMQALRATLLACQVDWHCRLIRRLLAPRGVCYLSFELFHAVPAGERWFLVAGVSKVLEIIGRHFLFNFDIIPEHESVTRFHAGAEPSLAFSFVLEAKDFQGHSPAVERST